jgi:hypothetical protein
MNSRPTDILPLARLSGNRQPVFSTGSLRRRGNDQPVSLIHTHKTWYLGAGDGPDALSCRGERSHSGDWDAVTRSTSAPPRAFRPFARHGVYTRVNTSIIAAAAPIVGYFRG